MHKFRRSDLVPSLFDSYLTLPASARLIGPVLLIAIVIVLRYPIAPKPAGGGTLCVMNVAFNANIDPRYRRVKVSEHSSSLSRGYKIPWPPPLADTPLA